MPGRPVQAGRARAFSAKAAMPVKFSDDDPGRAQRFRDAALPHLDDAYTLARYLLRDASDAEDAVQECYLRALKHFDSYRGPAMKPWLFAILRNVCRTEVARRASSPTDTIDEPFRETFVLREIHNLSYREIADIIEAPVGTVMSRLARARAMLRTAWLAEQEPSK